MTVCLRASIVLFCAFYLSSASWAADIEAAQCEKAASLVEQQQGIPVGLLDAIGRVESGRADTVSRRVMAWPWTINALGSGKAFETQADALVGTRFLQTTGVNSIDVGCFQVNLMHHRDAFSSLEDAFDPMKNASYAASFLKRLRDRTGSWEQAVANYHSASPEHGLPYRDRVLAAWRQRGLATAPDGWSSSAPALLAPVVIRAVTWSPSSNVRVWIPSPGGQGAAMITIVANPSRSIDKGAFHATR